MGRSDGMVIYRTGGGEMKGRIIKGKVNVEIKNIMAKKW